MRKIQVCSSLESLEIDGHVFNGPCRLDRFAAVLGPPSRTYDGPTPAPSGHRNNQRHIYDELGVYLIEWHANSFITSFNVVFDPAFVSASPEHAFCGTLSLGGVAFDGNVSLDMVLAHPTLSFWPHLGHGAYVEGDPITIDVRTRRAVDRKLPKRQGDIVAHVAIQFRIPRR
jgi:hypothetical protein